MHSDWRNFLQQQGAVFDAGRVLHFRNAEAGILDAVRGAVIADLSSDQGLIAVEGPDACSFLQGQLSTNVLALTPASSQFSSWNNAKGRVVTTLRVFERGDCMLLSLPQALATTVLKRLSMYVLRAKAKLTDASESLCQFGLAGDQATDLLIGCGLDAPKEIGAVTEHQGIQLIRLHGSVPRYVVLGDAARLQQLWANLVDHGARPAGSEVWALQRILAGEPEVHPETSEHFVAQMLGLEELGAIHFNKGCYLGQEVIARAHYRGAVKRHLHHAHCAAAASILPGALIYPNGAEQAVAEVVDACRNSDSIWEMLIVLQDEFAGAALQIGGHSVSLVL